MGTVHDVMRGMLESDVKRLVNRVREYSVSQKSDWQKIPFLALEADGRTGHRDNFARAYQTGYWALESFGRFGYYEVYVDLATGELVDAHSVSTTTVHRIDEEVSIPSTGPKKLASDAQVILLLRNLKELNAQRIVERLKECAKEPYGSYYKPEEKEEWRRETRERLGLEEIFVRG